MENVMFEYILDQSKYVEQKTSYLEISTYDDGIRTQVKEGALSNSDFNAWINQQGKYRPEAPPQALKTTATLRLILQPDCEPSTFEPGILTLPQSQYVEMTEKLNLSYRMLESSSNVGPFMWSVICRARKHKHLQLIYRSLQGMRAGHCQGWELSLAYSPSKNVTTGFFRGTPKSLFNESINRLRRNHSDFLYPLLLPTIIVALDMSTVSNTGLQCSRGWLQDIEDKLGQLPSDSTSRLSKLADLEDELLQIHKRIVAKNPQTQIEVLEVLRRTVKESAAFETTKDIAFRERRDVLNSSIRLNNTKLRGLQADVDVTISRIEILRSAIQNRFSVALADEQRTSDRVKHAANMRYSKNQQTFSILSVLFLPGTFFAAIFSTTFFDFHPSGNGAVSKDFWVFCAFTFPTMIALVVFLFWDSIYPGSDKFQCLLSWQVRRAHASLGSEKSSV